MLYGIAPAGFKDVEKPLDIAINKRLWIVNTMTDTSLRCQMNDDLRFDFGK